MRCLIIFASDDTFMPLLKGLVQSLHQWGPLPGADLACFDLGLSAASLAWLGTYTSRIVFPAWDLPVNEKLAAAKSHLRSMTVRPFLPRYFPGYDVYLWIDADAWVQEWSAVPWYLSAAAGGALAISSEMDQGQPIANQHWKWRCARLRRYFGEAAAKTLFDNVYYNSGVFALRAEAPHWQCWAKWFRHGLDAHRGKMCCDQTALNHAIWTEKLPVHPLPALCNWTCHLGLPSFDTATYRFVEPHAPHRPIGIIHLTAGTKDSTLEVLDDKGATRSVGLRYEVERQ